MTALKILQIQTLPSFFLRFEEKLKSVDFIRTKASQCRLVVVLALCMALLTGHGQRAGAGGFHPRLGQQGGADGGGGRHGDLDDLFALDESDEGLDAVERRLSVSLSLQQPVSCVHAVFEGIVQFVVLLLQMSTLSLQLIVSPQQSSLLLLPHCFVCDVRLNEVLWP